jgi:hypothetical protein
MMLIPFVLALATAIPQAPQAPAMSFSTPKLVTSLDKIKGEPTELAWSADGTQLYLETGDRTRIGTFSNPRHYVITVADGKVKSVDAPPQWATDYQAWKSNKWAPGQRSFQIEITEDKRMQRAVNMPMGGDLAKGGGASGSTVNDVVDATLTSQLQHVITLRLKGETVGEYVDTQFVPGYTFSWAPQSFGTAIAYTDPGGHLSVMDQQGGKKTVDSTNHVLVPAWSDSGKQIAFIQKDGKTFALYVTDVR